VAAGVFGLDRRIPSLGEPWAGSGFEPSLSANMRETVSSLKLNVEGDQGLEVDEHDREGAGGSRGGGRGEGVAAPDALAMRWRAVLACAVLILAAPGPAVAADEALWTLLRAGGQVIMLRHAGTIGTVGDPPGFQVEDCSTQRNLTEAGREQARKIGEAFRAREIPIARILSSPWCRCLDTARLAFGRVEPWWPLIGEPRAPDQISSRVRQIHEVLGTTPVGGNVVLVTHFVTVQDATGERIAEGELVVFTPRGDGQFTSVGRLAPGGLLCDPRSRLRPC